ncbi:MAG: hypothetical protein EKK55_13500 [Rhodocyclaceae bacterium]|nr:MAG: hypothetical protein EKK55_13500 [Rhodocyclaceae bacterium]
MKYAFTITQGDLDPDLVLTVVNKAGQAQSLAAAVSVTAYMLHLSSGLKLSPPAAISDVDGGEVTVSWAPSFTATPGVYRVWLRFVFTGGKPRTVPYCPDGEDQILIEICPMAY